MTPGRGLTTGLVLVGNPSPEHIGGHLHRAAVTMSVPSVLCDAREAFGGGGWATRLNWRLRGHRPSRLGEFSARVVETCRGHRPKWLLCTGIAPVAADALVEIGRLGVERLSYLTDDPWNRAHRAPWFMAALPHYDRVYSPRRANLAELGGAGCGRVTYLPFAYAPDVHFADPPSSLEEVTRFAADAVFAGGADRDRVASMALLVRAGFRVALYGGYWTAHRTTRASARGHADPWTLRKAIGGAKVALCLVRRANRDDHAMRTFELAAMGACMLTEDTPAHRALFGAEGEAVLYFRDAPEMVAKLGWLLARDEERARLAGTAHRRIVAGRHRYADRLATMLAADPPPGSGLGPVARRARRPGRAATSALGGGSR